MTTKPGKKPNCGAKDPEVAREQPIHLTVQKLDADHTWKDLVLIPVRFRLDRKGRPIHRGSICRISCHGCSKWVIVAGLRPQDDADRVIQMDLNVRLALDVNEGDVCDFELHRLSWMKRLWFPWRASDPGYRAPAQLAFVSLFLGTFLGIVGIILGILPFLHKDVPPQPCVASPVPTQQGK
jgi:hypothetical protein